MIRNFTILLFVLLFSFSFMYAKDKKIKKQLHQEKRSNYTILKTFHEPAEAVYNNDNNVSSNSSSINKGQLITKTSNGYTHVLIDSSRNGYGWFYSHTHPIDLFCGIDAYGQDVEFVLLAYRQYITSSTATGIIGATTIDVGSGLNGAPTYRHVELNQDLYEGTEGGRYPGVVALERPFIVFNQYISGNPPATPAISSPYIKTDYGSYGVYGGAFTPSYKMDQGYAHHDCPDGNRLWAGDVRIVKDNSDIYHYLGVYENWFLDSEEKDNDFTIMNASSSDPLSGWTIDTDPVVIDPHVVSYCPRPVVAMNSNGFGVICGAGQLGYHGDGLWYFSKMKITYETTEDYGETWSDPDTVSFGDLGFLLYHNPIDSLITYWEIQGTDTVEVSYDGPTFMGTNGDMDVIVDENNNIYVAFNSLWGMPGEEGWYPYPYYSGLFVAKKRPGQAWEAARISYNNGIYEGDENIAGMSDYFFNSEIKLAMDKSGNLYAAWLDRRRTEVELAEKPRYHINADLDYKTDIYSSCSSDGGLTWPDSAINITNSPSLDEYELKMSPHAKSESNNGTIYVAYCLVDPNSEPRPGGDDIYIDRVNRVWVAEATSFPVAIEDNSKKAVLKTFTLYQNYPNPFNPGTKIEFVPVKSGQAKLDVYSINGEKVAQLYNGYAKAGKKYAFDFDGSRLASGVYFYRLKIGSQVEVKKMALIK